MNKEKYPSENYNYYKNNQQKFEQEEEEGKEKKNRAKTPIAISTEKNISSNLQKPKLFIEAFMDYVEKLNEKTEIWQNKFITIFLKNKFMCIYDKKPGKKI